MIDEWVRFIELIDERNRLSQEISRSIDTRQKSQIGNKEDVKVLEGYIKRFKSEIARILKNEHKILFMVTTIKYPIEMRRKGFHSKKRGFIIDGNDYYVPNYYNSDSKGEVAY